MERRKVKKLLANVELHRRFLKIIEKTRFKQFYLAKGNEEALLTEVLEFKEWGKQLQRTEFILWIWYNAISEHLDGKFSKTVDTVLESSDFDSIISNYWPEADRMSMVAWLLCFSCYMHLVNSDSDPALSEFIQREV